MNYETHFEAEGEYQGALVYYGTRSAHSKLRFESEFESLVQRICDAPRLYAMAHPPDIRQARMRHFPYSIYFRETADGITIVSVAHSRRKPGYWLARL